MVFQNLHQKHPKTVASNRKDQMFDASVMIRRFNVFWWNARSFSPCDMQRRHRKLRPIRYDNKLGKLWCFYGFVLWLQNHVQHSMGLLLQGFIRSVNLEIGPTSGQVARKSYLPMQTMTVLFSCSKHTVFQNKKFAHYLCLNKPTKVQGQLKKYRYSYSISFKS